MTTSEFISTHKTDDVHRLALSKPPAGVDLHYALQQIEGWQLACSKLPTWAATDDIKYPPRIALEQCSSEATAQYKTRLLGDAAPPPTHPLLGRGAFCNAFADLTGGLGVDFMALAPCFGVATYVDRQTILVDAARHNASQLLGGATMERFNFVCATAEDYLREMEPVDVLYLDPARRDATGRKVALIADCSPDVALLHDLLMQRSRRCIIKLSPMLDITAALSVLPAAVEVHVVSVDGECKEVIVVLDREHHDIVIHCAMISKGGGREVALFSFTPAEEAVSSPLLADGIDEYVYEPDAALLKAGAFRSVALRYGLLKLATDTHLYTSSALLSDFPGRCWRVVGHCGFGKRELRSMLAGVRSAEIGVRGFPGSVASLRRQLHLSDGPDAHLIATTLADGSHRLLRVELVQKSSAALCV